MMATNINPHLLISYLRDLTSVDAKVSADSRQIEAGDIFFAYAVGHGNARKDSRPYIAAALANGAAAVIFDPADAVANEYLDSPCCFAVENLATIVGKLCAEWYGYPSKKLNIIGVTGTNGKTTVTQWLSQALNDASHRTAVMGTLGTGFPGALIQTGYTTPDAPLLQTQLKELLDAGAHQVAIEISSHALDQDRISGLDIHTAVFTNLTQDHLDYHGSMQEYAQAKAKLFQQFKLQNAIINFDDIFGRELALRLLAAGGPQIWGYALSKETFAGFEKFSDRLNCVYSKDTVLTPTGYQSKFSCDEIGSATVQLPVLGEFNLSNCLAVWTVLLAQGFSSEEISKRLAKLSPVAGRMELICLSKTQTAEGPFIVVDYAHTPDALAKALSALRPIASQRGGKVWCVFGCGGDRDSGKRSQMGRVAQECADYIIITSDNPRSEDPDSIIAMIKAGMSVDLIRVQTIPDRAAAIMAAVRHADIKDIVLVAGKGHESTQEINGKRFDFSDQEHIRLCAGGSR
ncbi:UDP-N-acetylmuramoyl-L-alanyl-D-glutamate--2,6-diaminopimelate ligase [Polynucleobacter sp. CS-Odin-A6]|uniref:UDP-N-acetylmuramoyl-L-alanyl-D-glutamate--2, 6-diaminopimelate ligase n=1 Tax=Polynucleobacter sp. CS-Odin-A6 TaxID=2689106 RepID=UPI0021070317|nr:UDP-N-acetylmuramoyl-L-alanyl-D-glutamate--2,6-diaminopimelate ligase [Polynucleobacter sp. CS-Odin-A6]